MLNTWVRKVDLVNFYEVQDIAYRRQMFSDHIVGTKLLAFKGEYSSSVYFPFFGFFFEMLCLSTKGPSTRPYNIQRFSLDCV